MHLWLLIVLNLLFHRAAGGENHGEEHLEALRGVDGMGNAHGHDNGFSFMNGVGDSVNGEFSGAF